MAPSAVLRKGQRAWYEVTFLKGSGYTQIGWATNKFEEHKDYINTGVGDDTHSWGFDGQRVGMWFNDKFEPWGEKVAEDHVLGIAADLERGQLLFGVDGNWRDPMGVALYNLSEKSIYPALTGKDMKIAINFGCSDMKFGPPDASFKKIIDVFSK